MRANLQKRVRPMKIAVFIELRLKLNDAGDLFAVSAAVISQLTNGVSLPTR